MATTKSASAVAALSGRKLTMTSTSAAMPYMMDKARMPPMRSASAPPTGRTSEPANTQAAVK